MNSIGLKLVLVALVMAGLVLTGFLLMPNRQAAESPSLADAAYFGKILLGPGEADDSKMIHFIVQGREIYVDKNRDGIPQPDERQTGRSLEPIEDTQSGVTYEVSGLRTGLAPETLSDNRPQQLGLDVLISGPQKFTQSGSIVMTRDATASNWLNFNGPVQMFYEDQTSLQKGSAKPTEVKIYLGTVAGNSNVDGEPSADTGDAGWMSRTAFIIPDETTPFPKVTIKYPSDGEPVVQELDLDTFC
jgi:hypothetical protein